MTKSSFGFAESMNRNSATQNCQMKTQEYLKSQQQNQNQSLIHQQSIQNIPLVEILDKNNSLSDNNGFNALHNKNSIQTSQPFTYLITSDVETYSSNNERMIRHTQPKNNVSSK